jgi:hypothetical protein
VLIGLLSLGALALQETGKAGKALREFPKRMDEITDRTRYCGNCKGTSDAAFRLDSLGSLNFAEYGILVRQSTTGSRRREHDLGGLTAAQP